MRLGEGPTTKLHEYDGWHGAALKTAAPRSNLEAKPRPSEGCGARAGHCSKACGLLSALDWTRSTPFRDMKKIKAGVSKNTRNARDFVESSAARVRDIVVMASDSFGRCAEQRQAREDYRRTKGEMSRRNGAASVPLNTGGFCTAKGVLQRPSYLGTRKALHVVMCLCRRLGRVCPGKQIRRGWTHS